MRTTVYLPNDLDQVVRDIAHDLNLSRSQAAIWLMRRGVGERLPEPQMGVDELTGFPKLTTGRLITASEVQRFLDEDD
jgi:hypothetical protein